MIQGAGAKEGTGATAIFVWQWSIAIVNLQAQPIYYRNNLQKINTHTYICIYIYIIIPIGSVYFQGMY